MLSRQNQLTLATLSDGRRAILYGAFGLIALLIAGSDELFSSGGGTLAWILLLGGLGRGDLADLDRGQHLLSAWDDPPVLREQGSGREPSSVLVIRPRPGMLDQLV